MSRVRWKLSRTVLRGWVGGNADPLLGVLEDGSKQPYFIKPNDNRPLFFAGLSSVKPGEQAREGDGFVIVTDASDAGMVDIHDRRPLVLDVEEARNWLDPNTAFEAANHMANNVATSVEAFQWFRVSKGVNKVGNDDPAFNEPIGQPD